MAKNTTRRDILRKSGLAVAGATALSGQALAGDADPRPELNDGQAPNPKFKRYWENDNVSKVMPWGSRNTVESGNWVIHDFGWAFEPELDEGGREKALEWTEKTTDIVKIDGEVMHDDDEHWIEPIPAPEDWLGTHISWQFTTPPKEPGTYRFEWDCYMDGERLYGGNVFPLGQEIEIVEGSQK